MYRDRAGEYIVLIKFLLQGEINIVQERTSNDLLKIMKL